MNAWEQTVENIAVIEQKLNYPFKDKNLLALAFVHRSFVNEHRQVMNKHNERLEFLGDAVLGMLISRFLYQNLPEVPEGELSHLRSRLVEAASCYAYIRKLEVEPFLLLGKGERMNEGRGRESILADLFEALIGAIYLDGGISAAEQFLYGHFAEEWLQIIQKPLRNWKAELQDYCQKKYQQTPLYLVLHESGPDHSKEFIIAVVIQEQQMGVGKGASKKEAQQAAARETLKQLETYGS